MCERQNEFSWSVSRARYFEACQRAYFFAFYGARGGWDPGAGELTRTLSLLTNLRTLEAWTGIVIHDAAAWAVRSMAHGALVPERDLTDAVLDRMNTELELSEKGDYREGAQVLWNGRMIKAIGLQEHHFRQPVPAAQYLFLARHMVRVLYGSRTFQWLRALPPESFFLVDALESFDVDGVKVLIRLDVAVQSCDGGLTLLKWKTGDPGRSEDLPFQLGLYGLYGKQTKRSPPERIRALAVNLREVQPPEQTLDNATLETTCRRIVEGAAAMRERLDDVAHNVTSIERFPKTNDLRRCRRCVYREVCGRHV